MATLQRFKLLATQCAAVAPSPTRSPAASPVITLRRRKTLRMLLGRKYHRADPPRPPPDASRQFRARHKLKDLFVSSPPPPLPPIRDGASSEKRREDRDRLLSDSSGDGLSARRGVSGPLRPLSAALRQRLLRKAWRPVLGAIPE